MRITHAQPLRRGRDYIPEPVPLLSEAEAEAEAFVFLREPAAYRLEEIGGSAVPGTELDADGFYTHFLTVVEAPEHTCKEYLVRVSYEAKAGDV